MIFQHPTWRFNEFQPQNMVSMAYSDFVLVAHSEWLKLRFKMLNLAGQTCRCGDVVSPGRPWWFWALSVERFGTKFEDSDSVSDEHELLFFKKRKVLSVVFPIFETGLGCFKVVGNLEDRSWRRSPSSWRPTPVRSGMVGTCFMIWGGWTPLKSVDRPINCCLKSLCQWEFQDPKMEVLYHIRPYFAGIFPYIGLT